MLTVFVVMLAWATAIGTLPPAMVRRGYDRTAWQVMSVLFGPVALGLAVLAVVTTTPRMVEVVRPGRRGAVGMNVLVVADGSTVPAAQAALRRVRHRVARLTLARVLPLDGPRDVERAAADALRADAEALDRGDAELVLLFGVASDVVAQHAQRGVYDLVSIDALPGFESRLPMEESR